MPTRVLTDGVQCAVRHFARLGRFVAKVIFRKHLKFLTPHDLTELLDMEGAFEVKEKVENSPVYSCGCSEPRPKLSRISQT